MSSRALRRLIEREWRRARHHLGHCSVCNQPIRHGEDVKAGTLMFPDIGLVLTRMHTPCWRQIQANPAVRDRVVDEAYRSLFGAGPDDVAGAA